MLDPLMTEAPRRLPPLMRTLCIINNVLRPLAPVSRWIDLYLQRAQLAELEDHQLLDLGLSRAQVRNECAKWPWQA